MARNRTITNPANDSSLSSAIIRTELQALEDLITFGPSIAGKPMGAGAGDITVSGATNVSAIDDADRAGLIQCVNFTVDAGQTLTVDTGWLWLFASGVVTIHGTISANALGEAGGTSSDCGVPASGMGAIPATLDSLSSTFLSQPVPFCLSGAGGAGGNDSGSTKQGAGGGAGGYGGWGSGGHAQATATAKILALLMGTSGSTVKGFNHFLPLVAMFRGAGGGGGSGVSGGNGGGCIFIECNELVFDGTLSANGANGSTTNGSSGGGGGGTIIVKAKTITTNTGTSTVTGGTGGGASGGGSAGGNGAAGISHFCLALA